MIYRKNTGKESVIAMVKAGNLTLAGCNTGAKKTRTYGEIGTYNPTNKTYSVECRGGRVLVENAEKDESKSTQVFFKDEKDALSNGFRPCRICFPSLYAEWNSAEDKDAWNKKRLAELG